MMTKFSHRELAAIGLAIFGAVTLAQGTAAVVDGVRPLVRQARAEGENGSGNEGETPASNQNESQSEQSNTDETNQNNQSSQEETDSDSTDKNNTDETNKTSDGAGEDKTDDSDAINKGGSDGSGASESGSQEGSSQQINNANSDNNQEKTNSDDTGRSSDANQSENDGGENNNQTNDAQSSTSSEVASTANTTITEVDTVAKLVAALKEGGEIKLTSNITAVTASDTTALLVANVESIIDLNGQTLTLNKVRLSVQNNVTIKDSSSDGGGKIVDGSSTIYNAPLVQVGANTTAGAVSGKLTIESGTIEASHTYFPMYVYSGAAEVNGGSVTSDYSGGYVIYNGANASLTINGGKVIANGDAGIAIRAAAGANLTINDGSIQVNGTRKPKKENPSNVNDYLYGYAVYLDGNNTAVIKGGEITATDYGYGIAAFHDTDVTISGGKIESYWFALSGNGTNSTVDNKGGNNAKFTITGGELVSSNGAAIYLPQVNGVTTISDNAVITGKTGVEIRAGSLTVKDSAVLTATATPSESAANGSGSTTNGAAIAVAQHTTKQEISVDVQGGTLKAYSPVFINNPQNNDEESIKKVTVALKDGTFISSSGDAIFINQQLASDTEAKIEDFDALFADVIKGGTFRITGDITATAITQLANHLDETATSVTLTNFVSDGAAAGNQSVSITPTAITATLPEETIVKAVALLADLGDLAARTTITNGNFSITPVAEAGADYAVTLRAMTPSGLVSDIETGTLGDKVITVSQTDDNGVTAAIAQVTVKDSKVVQVIVGSNASEQQLSQWQAVADGDTTVSRATYYLDSCKTSGTTLLISDACRVPEVFAGAAKYDAVNFTGTQAKLLQILDGYKSTTAENQYATSYADNTAASVTWNITLAGAGDSDSTALDVSALDEKLTGLTGATYRIAIGARDTEQLEVKYATPINFTLTTLTNARVTGASELTSMVANVALVDVDLLYNGSLYDNMKTFREVVEVVEKRSAQDAASAPAFTNVILEMTDVTAISVDGETNYGRVRLNYTDTEDGKFTTDDGALDFVIAANESDDKKFNLVVKDGVATTLIPVGEMTATADAGVIYGAFQKWGTLLADRDFVYKDEDGLTHLAELSYNGSQLEDATTEEEIAEAESSTTSIFTKLKNFFFGWIAKVIHAYELQTLEDGRIKVTFQQFDDTFTPAQALGELVTAVNAESTPGTTLVVESADNGVFSAEVSLSEANADLNSATVTVTLTAAADAADAGTAYTDFAAASSVTVVAPTFTVSKNATTSTQADVTITDSSNVDLGDVVAAIATITTGDSGATQSVSAVSVGAVTIHKDNDNVTDIVLPAESTVSDYYTTIAGVANVSVTIEGSSSEVATTDNNGQISATGLTNYDSLLAALDGMESQSTEGTYYGMLTDGTLITQTVGATDSSTYAVTLPSGSTYVEAVNVLDGLYAHIGTKSNANEIGGDTLLATSIIAKDGSRAGSSISDAGSGNYDYGTLIASAPTAAITDFTAPVSTLAGLSNTASLTYTTAASASSSPVTDEQTLTVAKSDSNYTVQVPAGTSVASALSQLEDFSDNSATATLAEQTTIEVTSTQSYVTLAVDDDAVAVTATTTDLNDALAALDGVETATITLGTGDDAVELALTQTDGKITLTADIVSGTGNLSAHEAAELYTNLPAAIRQNTTLEVITGHATTPTGVDASALVFATGEDGKITLTVPDDFFSLGSDSGDFAAFAQAALEYVDEVIAPIPSETQALPVILNGQIEVYNQSGSTLPMIALPEGLPVVVSQTDSVLTLAYPTQAETVAYFQQIKQIFEDYVTDNNISAGHILADFFDGILENLDELIAYYQDSGIETGLAELNQELSEATDQTEIEAIKQAIARLKELGNSYLLYLERMTDLFVGDADAIITVGATQYRYHDGQLVVPVTPTPAPTPTPSPSNNNSSSGSDNGGDRSDRHASGDNVPNEARDPGCQSWTPVGTPDLFQIDRRGSEATIYFTPVSDYTDRYHVIFGNQEGEEKYGGIAMQVDDERNTGVLAIDISNLDPSAQYSFKVAPVNNCAVGSWSNWLTAKGVSRYGRTTVKTYRYAGQSR